MDSSAIAIPEGFEIETRQASVPAIPEGFEIEPSRPRLSLPGSTGAMPQERPQPALPAVRTTHVGDVNIELPPEEPAPPPQGIMNAKMTGPAGPMNANISAQPDQKMPNLGLTVSPKPFQEGAIGRAFGLSSETPEARKEDPSTPLMRFEAATPQPGIGRAAAQFASGLTTPGNLAIMAATGGIGALETQLGKSAISKLISLGFSGQMIYDAAGQAPEVADAIGKGDWATARQHLTHMVLGAGMAALGIRHAASGRGEAKAGEAVSRPEESRVGERGEPLAGPQSAAIPEGFEVERPMAAPVGPPTAAQPTVPESPATLHVQMTQLNQGKRSVVMFPKGTEVPALPPDTPTHVDAHGNTYAYDPERIQPTMIDQAVASNALPQILGAGGMGAPDKSMIQGEPITVVGRTMDGTTTQATVTDQANLQATVDATKKVTPPGGKVTVEPAEQEIAARQAAAGELAAPNFSAHGREDGGLFLTAVRDNAEVGSAIIKNLGNGQFELNEIHVSTKARRQGIGSSLYRQAANEVAKIGGKLYTSPELTASGKELYDAIDRAKGLGNNGRVAGAYRREVLPDRAPQAQGSGPGQAELVHEDTAPQAEAPTGESAGAVAPTAPDALYDRAIANPLDTSDSFQQFLSEETGTSNVGAAEFIQRDVVPKAQSFLSGAKDSIDSLVHMVAPRSGVPPKSLDQVYRMKGGRDAMAHILHQQLDAWNGRMNKMSQPEMVDFIDRQKTGQPHTDPELQSLGDFLRKADDGLYEQLKQYKPSLPFLENHYRVLWKELPQGVDADVEAGVPGKGFQHAGGKRPLQGSKGMLKQHTLDTMSEGLERGGVPFSYNPIRMFEASYADAMKYITAQRMWESYKDLGARKFFKSGQSAKARADGFVQLDDRIAKTYFPTEAGMVNTGEWWVKEPEARVLNNFLSRDLIRESPVGRALMGIKNATTAVELSLSPFHLAFITNEAAGSQIGMGLRKMWNLGLRGGDWKGAASGLQDIATSPAAVGTTAQLGSKAKQAFSGANDFAKSPEGQAFLKAHPDAADLVHEYFMGGGILGQHQDFKIQAYNNFREELNSGNKIGAAIRGIPLLNQAIMNPLFDKLIPNVKLGFFLKEMPLAKMEYADRLASGEMTEGQLARKVVDSIENRFGEMNFDNLYWKRTFKTALQLMFRSVTWKLGNLREYSSAVAGQAAEVGRGLKTGQMPLLHPSMAWLAGMSLWTAVLGGTIHTLATGKPPDKLKDVVYPVIDGATGIRASVPTYWRDMIHAAHSPLGYVKSSLSGEMGRVADIWNNKDFYGNEVRNADDPWWHQGWDMGKHLVPMPFSISSAQQAGRQGGSQTAKLAGYAGFTKAPRYIEETPAQQMASEYSQQHREVGSRTAVQAAASQARSGILALMRAGRDATPQIQTAITQGLIVPKDVPKLRKIARTNMLVGQVQHLNVAEALNVYDAASPEERQNIALAMRKKLANARTQPKQWTPRAAELSTRYFGIHPARLPDLSAPGPVNP